MFQDLSKIARILAIRTIWKFACIQNSQALQWHFTQAKIRGTKIYILQNTMARGRGGMVPGEKKEKWDSEGLNARMKINCLAWQKDKHWSRFVFVKAFVQFLEVLFHHFDAGLQTGYLSQCLKMFLTNNVQCYATPLSPDVGWYSDSECCRPIIVDFSCKTYLSNY